MAKHARISPSALSRIIACPGSVAFCAELPDTPSAAAETGTLAHELLEHLLKGTRVRLPKGTDPEMSRHVREAYAFIQQLAQQEGSEVHSEVELPVGHALGLSDPGACWGTADVVISSPDALWVIDFKYGHHPVLAKNNPQLMAYAVGALHLFGDTGQKVILCILQPRVQPEPQLWEPSDDEFNELGDLLANAIETALTVGVPRTPGEDQCRWCRGAAVCPELRRQSVDGVFAVVTEPPQAKDLEATAIAAVLKCKPLVQALLRAVESEALRRMLTGGKVPGYKLVEGTTRRAWSAGVFLEGLASCGLPVDKLAPRTLVSPAQAEKLVPDALLPVIKPFIVKPRGQPTVAPESDRRPSIGASDFDVVDTE